MSGQTIPKLVPQGDASTSFVLKIAALCNINCTYCYMYNKGDTSFLGKPKVMCADVVQATLDAIVTYARAHELPAVSLVLHGGEPLLVGIPWMSEFLRRVEATFVDVRAVVSLQTNATLVTPEWVSLLVESDVRVGVSLDGPPEVHDRHRVSHAGLGTYEQTRRGLDLLIDAAGQHGLRVGALCVADAGVDGGAVFEHFVDLGLRRLDFLSPDYNHDVPPPWAPGELAQYYLDVFNAWYGGRDRDVTVRWFNSAMHLMLGGPSLCENSGGGPVASVVVETDGSLQPLDTLRVSYDGFTHTGLSVFDNTIDDLRETPVFVACLAADAGLPEGCRACALLDICGGGYLPHRFGRGRQFRNESVHCLDLKIVLHHVREVIRQDLQPLVAAGAFSPSV
jgi:uncharacterized protein